MTKTVYMNDTETGEESIVEGPIESKRVYIGRVPVMLRSTYCTLANLSDDDLIAFGECPYDQGGYFIINGSEKVIIAQEKLANNHVYVFYKGAATKYSYTAEIRSSAEKGSKKTSQLSVKMLKSSENGASGQYIKATLPYISQEVPIAIVFRALGFVADKDILDHICYDFNDQEMLELLKPCIEEAFVIQDENVALDFIGRRGRTVGANQASRIRYAKDILRNEFLPHVENSETRKAFFFGYMVHRLCLAALERREPDDRDHYGKKRMDLAGPLLASLFRQLFQKLTKDLSKYLQKVSLIQSIFYQFHHHLKYNWL